MTGDGNIKRRKEDAAWDGDLKRKEAAASEEGGDPLKMNEAMVNLAGLFRMKSTAEAGRKETVESGAGYDHRDVERKEASPCDEEEAQILRLKKEREEAWDLWEESFVPGALDRWLERKAKPEEEAQAPGVGKKRKKVVKKKLSTRLVDYMAAHPYKIMNDISDEVLATRIPEFRQYYAITKILEAKTREYRNALVAQQEKLGYAVDVDEVTDDELEGVEN